MGLLKHVVLPLYALIDLAVLSFLFTEEADAQMLETFGKGDSPLTDLELHLMHAIAGVGIILLVNNIAAIFVENSHYRGMAVVLQMLFFSVDTYSYIAMGKDIPGILYFILGLGFVGLVVHSQEPGIFTKDHGPGKSKKG